MAKRTPDLEYDIKGFWTTFYPVTEAGHDAWMVIHEGTGGTDKILTMHLDSVLRQLRKAGYSVHKAKDPNPNMTDEELLAALGL